MAKTDDSIWTFNDSSNGTHKIYVIGIDSAKRIVELMDQYQLSQWLVRNKDWSESKSILSCPELMELPPMPASATVASSVPVKKALPTFEELSPSSRVTDPSFEINEVREQKEKRKNKRLNAEFRVYVFVKDKVFKTKTKDVSMGGLFLESPIPQDLKGSQCRVVLGTLDNKLNIEFHAVLKDLSHEGSRIVFSGEQARVSLEQLRRWMESPPREVSFRKVA